MKILVTGGAGFIGSHVVDKLIEKGDEVFVIDNLSTGKEENLNSEAEFYKVDVNSEILEEVFKIEFDAVIHLAAQASVGKSIKDPLHDAKTNILGSLNLIELSKKYGVEKFVYINSAAIFGNPEKLPIDEEHVREPLSNYGISKNVVEDYLRVSGLKFISLRLANVYGPRQIAEAEGGVIAIFTDNVVSGKESLIRGDGEQTRDFVFVKDVANAIICAIENGEGCLNIGTGEKITINELYKEMANLADCNLEAKHIEERKGDIKESVFQISKAKEVLKWEAETSLQKGLRETIDEAQD
jgi:UDP-glucose 4-epimerase